MLENSSCVSISVSLSTESALHILGDKVFKGNAYSMFQIFLVLIPFSQFLNVAAASAPVEQWNRSVGGKY